jgi:hypothetical protein
MWNPDVKADRSEDMRSTRSNPDSVVASEGGAEGPRLWARHLEDEVECAEAPGRGDLTDTLDMVNSNPNSL